MSSVGVTVGRSKWVRAACPVENWRILLCKVLLPVTAGIPLLTAATAHSDYSEDARVLLSSVIYIVSVPFSSPLWTTTTTLHPFNGLFSRTTWVSRCQKGKTSLDLTEARDYGVLRWQWHHLDHMQTICISLQTDNHSNTSSVNFYTPDALPDAQPTVSKHWRQQAQKVCYEV